MNGLSKWTRSQIKTCLSLEGQKRYMIVVHSQVLIIWTPTANLEEPRSTDHQDWFRPIKQALEVGSPSTANDASAPFQVAYWLAGQLWAILGPVTKRMQYDILLTLWSREWNILWYQTFCRQQKNKWYKNKWDFLFDTFTIEKKYSNL